MVSHTLKFGRNKSHARQFEWAPKGRLCLGMIAVAKSRRIALFKTLNSMLRVTHTYACTPLTCAQQQA